MADVELARAIASRLRRSHHRVAKDTRAYLVGGRAALLRETDARQLDRRATTRAERKVAQHLVELGLAPPRVGMPHAEQLPFFELRAAVTGALIAGET